MLAQEQYGTFRRSGAAADVESLDPFGRDSAVQLQRQQGGANSGGLQHGQGQDASTWARGPRTTHRDDEGQGQGQHHGYAYIGRHGDAAQGRVVDV